LSSAREILPSQFTWFQEIALSEFNRARMADDR
jgi:hypothetical protein